VSRQKALTFQTRDIADSGGITTTDRLSIIQGFWLDGFLGVEPRNVGVALTEGLWDLRGITSAEGLRDGEAGRAPFALCPHIHLTTEEKHGKPHSGRPSSHRTAHCAGLAVF
jgi:hypothetical protein